VGTVKPPIFVRLRKSLVDDGAVDPEAFAIKSETRSALWRELERLETFWPREYEVLILRFVEEQTLAQVGKRLGISRERVRQIEISALAKLRKRMESAA
jgi:RNA polymerase sigma factor (sigma-70 family)